MRGLGHPRRLHLNGQSIVVMLADPASMTGNSRVLHDLAGGDWPETDLRNRRAGWQAPGPVPSPGEVPRNLVCSVGDFPDARPGLESVILAGTAVVCVDMRRYHHVAEVDFGPQRSGHADEQNGSRSKLGYSSLGQDCRRVVPLAYEREGHPAVAVANPADLESGAGLVRV